MIKFLMILYLNEATAGASFMSFGRSFQTRTVEGKKQMENKFVCTHSVILASNFQHSEGYM